MPGVKPPSKQMQFVSAGQGPTVGKGPSTIPQMAFGSPAEPRVGAPAMLQPVVPTPGFYNQSPVFVRPPAAANQIGSMPVPVPGSSYVAIGAVGPAPVVQQQQQQLAAPLNASSSSAFAESGQDAQQKQPLTLTVRGVDA